EEEGVALPEGIERHGLGGAEGERKVRDGRVPSGRPGCGDTEPTGEVRGASSGRVPRGFPPVLRPSTLVLPVSDLFDAAAAARRAASAPLADRMRPQTLDQFVGQAHILGPGKLLRRAVEADRVTSVIFFGPP